MQAPAIPTNLLLLVAALIVSGLILLWLVAVVKTTLQVALLIAGLVLILQMGFGIKFDQLTREIMQLPQWLFHLFKGS